MSKAEILAELPKLRSEEREQVLQKLCELEEADIVKGKGLRPEEKKLLDDALANFERDGNPGTPWRDVLKRLRSNRAL